MPVGCCKLVGEFPINTDKCFVSISVSSSTESSLIDNQEIIIGPTVGTVSVGGFADNEIHVGCPGRASVQIPWLRKWDCDNNNMYFISQGEGRSSIFGDVAGYASLHRTIGSYRIVNASSSSGPAALYTDEIQTDGYGLTYNGEPISFSTGPNGVTWDGAGLGLGVGTLYLQNFNLELTPGELPMATYSFVFVGSLA
jgi:hypothetical protein